MVINKTIPNEDEKRFLEFAEDHIKRFNVIPCEFVTRNGKVWNLCKCWKIAEKYQLNKTIKKVNIPEHIQKEAFSISGGIYSWNVKEARWYGFDYNQEEITYGMFVYKNEGIYKLNGFDGYIDRKTGEIFNLIKEVKND